VASVIWPLGPLYMCHSSVISFNQSKPVGILPLGTKMTPRSWVGDDVSGSKDSATDPVSGDYDSDGENQAGPLKSNIVKLSCKLSAYVDTCILYFPEIPNTWICLGIL
jgi:hypothetical protein